MSKVITPIRARLAEYRAAHQIEAIRSVLVCSTAIALIAAGRAFPF
jgi:hypothetical protein